MATSGPKTMRNNPLDALSVESINKVTSSSKQRSPRTKKGGSADTAVASVAILDDAVLTSSPVPVEADGTAAEWGSRGDERIIEQSETPAAGQAIAALDLPLVVLQTEAVSVPKAMKAQNLFAQVLGPVQADASRVATIPVSAQAVEIVRKWAQWSVVGSMVPAPLIDSMLISAAQIKMIHALCQHYDVPFERKVAVAVASGLVGGTVTTAVAQVATRAAIKSMPLVGTLFTFTAEPALSYVTTYGIGYAFIRHFELKGTLSNFTSEKMKLYFAEHVEQGKNILRRTVTPAAS